MAPRRAMRQRGLASQVFLGSRPRSIAASRR
jgi:hypothetical protein